jgi:hypothetical protein|tara:strand:- start:23 stop:421 length:399 start_codon:yes stop_codon:yes gene_type:complete
MIKSEVQEIINEVYPKIEKYYGFSKYFNCTPFIELHHNIYERTSGEIYDEEMLDELECNPDAEFERTQNTIVVYYPKMVSKQLIIETLIHEYQHYLQSPTWFTRYYNMGFEYNNHPYEVAATKSESNWKMFA